MCHFPLLKSFQRIQLSPNHAGILCIILVLLSSSTKYWESPLSGCLPLLIKYICSYLPHLEAVRSTCSLMKCAMLPRGDNFWWFSEAGLKFNRKPKIMLGFLMLHVRWSLMWNVTEHQLGEPSAPDCDRFIRTVCIFHCAWKLEAAGFSHSSLLPTMLHGARVDCSVVIILAEYVLCLRFKNAVDNFPVVQGSWKADIRSSSQEIPSFNGKLTFVSELKSACHWGPLYTVRFFFLIVCEPCISHLHMLLL